MSLGLFIGVSLIWTGMLAGAAELLSRYSGAHFARTIWRGAAFLMVLPWLTAGAAYLWPSAMGELPIPAMPDFGLAAVDAGLPDAAAPGDAFPITLTTALIALLAAGWVLRFICALRAQRRLQSLKSTAQPVTDADLMRVSEQWAERSGIKSSPAIMSLEHAASPFTAGIQQSRIYLPVHLVGSGHEDMIIAHESIHIARHDHITRPFERIVADLLWFSPFAWLARRRLDFYREASCDARTIALTGSPKAYAQALVDVARQQASREPLPVAAFILKDRGSLKRRVSSVMNTQGPSPSRLGWIAGLAALLAVPLALAQGIKANGPSDVFTHPIVATGKIVSPYGVRKDPYTEKDSWHAGIDIAGEMKQVIMTPASGKVIFADYKKGYGKKIVIELADKRRISFGHLYKIKVKKGDLVEAGQIIGLMGSTGPDRKPHVHFEVLKPGEGEIHGKPAYKQYDPQRFDIDFIGN